MDQDQDDYKVGTKVRCVVGGWGAATGTELQRLRCPNMPVVGREYTIRTVEWLRVQDGQVALFLRFVELINPVMEIEAVFYACRFAPIKQFQEDISAFNAILRNPNRRIPYKSSIEKKYDKKIRKVPKHARYADR